MAELATLARPYAEAVFDLAKASNDFDTWSADLAFLAAVVADPLMRETIDNPRIEKATLEKLLLDIASNHLSAPGQNLLKLLIKNGRLRTLPHLLAHYERLKAEHQGYIQVHVKSPYALDEAQQQTIATALQARFGKTAKIDVEVDPDAGFIGGVQIHAGDSVIDATITGRLQRLASALR